MSKIKQILITTIIGIAMILGISTTANAASYPVYSDSLNLTVGTTFKLKLNEYKTNNKLYCMQHSRRLTNWTWMKYKVVSTINITGDVSKDYKGKEITNKNNAIFAYILSADNGSSKTVGPVAKNVWLFKNTWMSTVGKNHAGLSMSYIEDKPGASVVTPTTASKKLLEEAKEYANSIGKSETNSIVDKTNKSNIKVTTISKNNSQYVKAGPFKWEFNGKLTSITVTDKEGKATSATYSVYQGNEEKTVSVGEIKSGQEFYVTVPMTTGIKTITAKAEVGEVKSVDIVFMQSEAYKYQNLIKVTPKKGEPVKIENSFDYNVEFKIKLSGYVWLDKISGKQSYRNDLFKDNDYDINDMLLDGITVRLKDKSGNVVKETKTANGSGYVFEDVLISELSKYYIEFEYDGLTYTNVVPHIDKDNGSKSAENSVVRDEFNKNFSIVEGKTENTSITRDSNGNEKHTLTYNLDQNAHTATLINNGNYPITATTNETGYSIIENYKPGMDEIKNINLGLYEREQPDISLIKDLENVKVSVNGYNHVYNYAQRFANQGEYGDGFNVGVKFGNKYGSMSYSRAIYQADYEYTSEDKSKELKVYVTYKLAMKNQSTNLTVAVNSIVDYYDSNYSIIKVGTALDDQGNVTGDISHQDTSYNEKYAKTIINNNSKIEAQKQTEIYVQFELNKEAVINILNDKENLENVAEINSYSVFDKDGKVYAGIDKNSNPGNVQPENKATYQDDTDSAPGLKLEVADSREMSGKVFLDETSQELMTGKVRQGSGSYEEGEKGIEGVKVTLTENTGTGKVYEAVTDSNGDFLITGYIPGDYTLTYTWGDKTYTVQNYKGTVYDISRDQNNKNWYKENVETRLTDAMDDYTLRQSIDNEMMSATNATTTTIEKMNSTTPTMGIGVEYETTHTASSGDKYTYRISNVDFGIVERARQDISLEKRVKTFKVTLANGQVVADVTIDENGKMTGEKNHVTYMGPSEKAIPSNGFVKLELDNELIQGAILEVGYEIKATNNSELDYLSENFYKYGKIEGNIVTITPSAIIDYLDKDWNFEQQNNEAWQVKTLDDIKNIVDKTVYENENSSVNDKTILYTEKLKDQKLEPTKSASVMINVSKTLTTSDEISLDNEVEFTKIEKTGGSKLTSTPGNYIPGTGKTENDDSTAETVIITPNTGNNLAYIVPITVGLIALVILGAGVVLIKKKTLENK